jgi:hypothetical protein
MNSPGSTLSPRVLPNRYGLLSPGRRRLKAGCRCQAGPLPLFAHAALQTVDQPAGTRGPQERTANVSTLSARRSDACSDGRSSVKPPLSPRYPSPSIWATSAVPGVHYQRGTVAQARDPGARPRPTRSRDRAGEDAFSVLGLCSCAPPPTIAQLESRSGPNRSRRRLAPSESRTPAPRPPRYRRGQRLALHLWSSSPDEASGTAVRSYPWQGSATHTSWVVA